MNKRGTFRVLIALAIVVALVAIAMVAVFAGCDNTDDFKIGVLHINPKDSTSGYTYAHQQGIEEAKTALNLTDENFIYKDNLPDNNAQQVNTAIQDLIDAGCKMIIGTSFGYQSQMIEFAKNYPEIIFAHGTGFLNTMGEGENHNMTNYFGRIYQVRYLSGLVAGMTTETGKLGYVSAQDTTNAECTSGVNAFALGAQAAWAYRGKNMDELSVNVKVLNSWYDPTNESAHAQALLESGCDIVTQHCDTENPSVEAKKVGMMSIGYNSDMGVAVKDEGEERDDSVLTSVLWHWGPYYTQAIQAAMDCFKEDGTFTTEPWEAMTDYYGSYADGLFTLAPFSSKVTADTQGIVKAVEAMMSNDANRATWDVFCGKTLTFTKGADGTFTATAVDSPLLKSDGTPAGEVTDTTIRSSMPWYVKGVNLMAA